MSTETSFRVTLRWIKWEMCKCIVGRLSSSYHDWLPKAISTQVRLFLFGVYYTFLLRGRYFLAWVKGRFGARWSFIIFGHVSCMICDLHIVFFFYYYQYTALTLLLYSFKYRWLSGSELKKVALFGCPSIERKSVFAAKRLRAFFRIQEDVVSGCAVII